MRTPLATGDSRHQLRLATLLRVSNVWLFETPEGERLLVDTGHPVERPLLALELSRAGIRRPGDLTAVLLTHRHSDHAGNAAWLRDKLRCPVYCHPDDAAALAGQQPVARLARGVAPLWAEVLCRIEDRAPARLQVDGTYETERWRWGFQVVHAPGHTEGTCLLYHEASGVLFSGDAILAGPPPLRAIERLRLADAAFSEDVERCHAHVLAFLEGLPRASALCSGHGPPVMVDVAAKLARLRASELARLQAGELARASARR